MGGSTGDGEDPDSCLDYLVTRNPRRNPSPELWPPESLTESLSVIESKQHLLQYIYKYRKVPFRIHVKGIEILYNAAIEASHIYQKLLYSPYLDAATASIDNALIQVKLRHSLLELYVTFYSIRKMHRRFQSTMLKQFHTAMTDMRQATVFAAVKDSGCSEIQLTFTDLEHKIFELILGDPAIPRTEFQILRRIFSPTYADGKDSTGIKGKTTWKATGLLRWLRRLLGREIPARGGQSGQGVGYSKECAWDIHRLLVWVLNKARASVDILSTLHSANSVSFVTITNALESAQKSMARLHSMVHHSSLVQTHLKAIESTLSKAMNPSASQEIDEDGGLADISVEIDLARANHRVGEQCLWQLVRYQEALKSLTAQSIIPSHAVTFTLFTMPAGDNPEIARKTALHDWKDVIAAIYAAPSATFTSSAGIESISTDTAYISADEAVSTLEEYGRNNATQATHILRKPNHMFYGSWHAEAVLGTFRHLSRAPTGPTTVGNIDLSAFYYTLNSIGVSKRCCPVCEKLLYLLGAPGDGSGGIPPIVLSAHQNFYPTGLPPHLPKHIAVELLQWLEQSVKVAVDKLVLKHRRGSQRTQQSSNSTDSKGDSPRKRKKEYADACCILQHL